jgi:hypothetical protein
MSTCKSTPSTLTHHSHTLLRLADHDMFMRFCGGGVGHLYMYQVEPWLDVTGWGATWPSLADRDPAAVVTTFYMKSLTKVAPSPWAVRYFSVE